MSDDMLSALAVVDNCWIYARTEQMLEDMLVLANLNRHSHSFPMSGVVWCSTIADAVPASASLGGTSLLRKLRSEGFLSLDSYCLL